MAKSFNELPHDLLAEKSLLGCILLDSMAFDQISDLSLKPEDFYHPQYANVFGAIKDLMAAAKPVDYITVCSQLTEQGKIEAVGGQSSILELVEDQASAAHAYHYGKTVKEKSVLRSIVRNAQSVIEKGTQFKGNTKEFLSEVEASFFKLTNEAKDGGMARLSDCLKTNLKQLEDNSRHKGEIAGLPTGFKALDRILLGMQPGQLIVLAARPAMGKTSFALNMTINACKHSGLPVAIFSMEMVATELSQRLLSGEAGIDSKRLRSKNFLDSDFRKIGTAVQALGMLPIYINDRADTGLIEIMSQCRKIKTDQGLGMVVIDYLQLMKPPAVQSREQQIAEISRGLKNLAKEMECPVMALSQLNRSVETRTDKRPMVSDLRESGAIEQDADIVMMIYRDEVYHKDASKEKGIAEIIVGKNRAGETGTAKLAWVGATTSFHELSNQEAPPQGVSH